MSRKLIAVIACLTLMVGFVTIPATGQDDAKPKYTIKDVMKKAMKGPLLKKVAGGGASDDEKKELYEMLVALGKNEPKKGEAESWKTLTAALEKAGKAAIEGESDASKMLEKAADCKACHTPHK
jgi:hypothetical protein